MFEGRGSPVMSITGKGDMVVAGYTTGHIRIFSRKRDMLAVEVAGHCRPVSALAMHPSQDQFVSVGEDTYINVWTLPDFESKSSSTLDVLFSSQARAHAIAGGRRGPPTPRTARSRGHVLVASGFVLVALGRQVGWVGMLAMGEVFSGPAMVVMWRAVCRQKTRFLSASVSTGATLSRALLTQGPSSFGSAVGSET